MDIYNLFTPNQIQGLVIIGISLAVFAALFFDSGKPPHHRSKNG